MHHALGLAAILLAGGCARTLSDAEAHDAHVRNETALPRALQARGLDELFAVELAEPGPAVAAPTITVHPQLGRVLEVVSRPDVVFAVDRAGVVHEVSIAYHATGHVKEDVHQCGPGSSGGTPQGSSPEPREPGSVRHHYYRLTATQVVGPALSLRVDTLDIEPIYVTGKACREIP